MKTMIALPAMPVMMTACVRSLLAMRKHGEIEYAFTDSSLVFDARNKLAEKAINDGFDRILWLDTDMVFQPDLFERLSADLDEGREYVCGLCTTRRDPIIPVIYDYIKFTEKDGPQSHCILDYPKDKVFEIAASGFGCVMMTVQLAKDIGEVFGHPFAPIPGFGEDLSFCMRASQMGRRMFCDPSVRLGHIGYKTYAIEDVEKGG